MLFERFMCLDADLLKLKTDLFVKKEEIMDKIFYPDSKASKRHPAENVNENAEELNESEEKANLFQKHYEECNNKNSKEFISRCKKSLQERKDENSEEKVIKPEPSIESSINELKSALEKSK